MGQVFKCSDIILASREEYKKIYNEFNALKAMTELSPNNKFDYYVQTKYGESDLLLYMDIEHKSYIKKAIERLGIFYYLSNYEVLKDSKDNYYIKSDNFNIKITDKKKFDKIAENLKSSDFCNNFLTAYQDGLQELSYMARETNYIVIIANLTFGNKNCMCKLYYDVETDLLTIICPRGTKIDKKVIETMLSLPFEIKNDYVENLIKNNSAYNKKIYIDSEIDAKRKLKLSMKETDSDILVVSKQEKTMLKKHKKS